MRMTESRIRQIIREEANALQEMRAPGYLSPRRTFDDIRKLVDEALMNKSFGFSQRVTDKYIQELNNMIDYMNNGGQDTGGEEWDQDKHGFGGVGPRD